MRVRFKGEMNEFRKVKEWDSKDNRGTDKNIGEVVLRQINSQEFEEKQKIESRVCSDDEIRSCVRKLATLNDRRRAALCEILYKNKEVMENNIVGINVYKHIIKMQKNPSYISHIQYRYIIEL